MRAPVRTESRDGNLFAALAPEGEIGGAFLLRKGGVRGTRSAKKRLARLMTSAAESVVMTSKTIGSLAAARAAQDGDAGRLTRTGMLATTFRVVRSIMSTAPGSAPIDSQEM